MSDTYASPLRWIRLATYCQIDGAPSVDILVGVDRRGGPAQEQP